ncbi:uncharacterized protein LOC144001149 isoform X2 [Festucalex cinctus]
MYRPGQHPCGPPSFGVPPCRGRLFNVGAPCGPSPGHLPPGPAGPFSSSALLHNQFQQRPPGPDYINASDKSKKVQCINEQQHDTSLENDSMLLPHDRVGSDFSWLQPKSQTASKADRVEDEEWFLYGDENSPKKTLPLMTNELVQPKCDEMKTCDLGSQQQNHDKSNFRVLDGLSSSQVFANLDNNECEKIKKILNNLGKTNNSEKPLPSEPSPSSAAASLGLISSHTPNVRHALESLQSLIKATKEKREKCETDETSLSSYDKRKPDDESERKKAKRAKIAQTEVLMKEVGELLKEEGFNFLVPVIGFYCQICEEFIGNLSTAENHAAIHCHRKTGRKSMVNKHTEATRGHSSCSSSSSSKHHPKLSEQRDSHTDRGDDKKHGNHNDRCHERDHRIKKEDGDHSSHRPVKESNLIKEMRNEKMLITVCVGSSNVEERNKNNESHAKVKEEASSTGKFKNVSKKDAKEENESHDSSDDQGDESKVKSHKKKKKKDKKKKDKKKKRNDS